MKTIKKKLNTLTPFEQNTRYHGEVQLQEFEKSLNSKWGQYRPLVIDESGVILVGNGMYQAMLRAGWDSAECIQLTDLTEDEKKKLVLSDNKIYELGGTNTGAVDEIIRSLDDYEIPGYDSEILKELYEELDISNYGNLPEEIVSSIKSREEKRIEDPTKDVPSHEKTTSAYEAVEISERYVNCPHCGAKIYI